MESLKGVNETAAILGISPWTVRYLLKIGKLPKIKVGRRVLVEPIEIQKFIERCKELGQQEQEN